MHEFSTNISGSWPDFELNWIDFLWMSFPGIRSSSCPKYLPIRIKSFPFGSWPKIRYDPPLDLIWKFLIFFSFVLFFWNYEEFTFSIAFNIDKQYAISEWNLQSWAENCLWNRFITSDGDRGQHYKLFSSDWAVNSPFKNYKRDEIGKIIEKKNKNWLSKLRKDPDQMKIVEWMTLSLKL